MTTYTFTPSGKWTDVGIREGGGLLGMGHPSGKMKAFKFEHGVAGDMVAVGADFGPRGAGITAARDDVIMTITLFRKPSGPATTYNAYEGGTPVYRSLGAAMVTASDTDIGVAVAEPRMDDDDIDGVVVELFFCKVITGREATNDDTDAMCREILRAQASTGSTHAAVTTKLDALEGKSFCPCGHGPYPHRMRCPDCQALCVCH